MSQMLLCLGIRQHWKKTKSLKKALAHAKDSCVYAAPTKPAREMLPFDCGTINIPKLLGNFITHFHTLDYWDS